MCSAGLWLMPFSLGTNTMPVGHTRASIWASWPAPEGMRRTEWPSRCAVASTRSITLPSNSTGSKRARLRAAMVTPSAAASASARSASRRSASCSADSSVLRRSTVSVAAAGTTLTRFGCSPEAAHRADLVAAQLEREVAHLGGQGGGHETRVVAVVHGRGAGVVGLAGDGQLLPRDALHAR